MKITRKIRKDLLLLECYARPNNPRQGAEGGRGCYKQKKQNQYPPAFVAHFRSHNCDLPKKRGFAPSFVWVEN